MVENFSKISQTLKSARIKAGLSLEDVQKITKIKIVYLQAIDDGDPTLISNDFYSKMYIKRYADAVNINIDQLIKLDEIDSAISRSNSFSESAILENKPTIVNRVMNNWQLIVIAAVLLIGLLIFWVNFLNQNSVNDNKTEDTIQISSKEPGSTDKNANLSDSNDKKQSATKLIGPEFEQATASFICEDQDDHQIAVQVGSLTWVEVIIDDVPVFAGSMADGSEQTFDLASENSNITIHTGNSRETGISFDGEVLNFKDGSPIEINNITIDR